jgi:hypothetical protein
MKDLILKCRFLIEAKKWIDNTFVEILFDARDGKEV